MTESEIKEHEGQLFTNELTNDEQHLIHKIDELLRLLNELLEKEKPGKHKTKT